MSKIVYRYGTGHVIPDKAVYLTTIVQEITHITGEKSRYVWHYYEVAV